MPGRVLFCHECQESFRPGRRRYPVLSNGIVSVPCPSCCKVILPIDEAALAKNGYLLAHCYTPTSSPRDVNDGLKLAAVAGTPLSLQVIPLEQRAVGLCFAAVMNDPAAIAHVPEGEFYSQLAVLAVQKRPGFGVVYVKHLTADVAIAAMETDLAAICHMNWPIARKEGRCSVEVPHEVIQWLAYRLWAQSEGGDALSNWLDAEFMLKNRIADPRGRQRFLDSLGSCCF